MFPARGSFVALLFCYLLLWSYGQAITVCIASIRLAPGRAARLVNGWTNGGVSSRRPGAAKWKFTPPGRPQSNPTVAWLCRRDGVRDRTGTRDEQPSVVVHAREDCPDRAYRGPRRTLRRGLVIQSMHRLGVRSARPCLVLANSGDAGWRAGRAKMTLTVVLHRFDPAPVERMAGAKSG